MGGRRVSPDRLCSMPECGRIYFSSGYCNKHYQRVRYNGDPNVVKSMKPSSFTVEERLVSKTNQLAGWPNFGNPLVDVTPEDGQCWDPNFSRVGVLKKYKQISVNGRLRYVHRVAYELWVGEIPEGLQIDHRCMNTVCINPKHLITVTSKQNSARRNKPNVGGMK